MYVMVYHGGLRDTQDRRKRTDEVTEAVVEQLHSDRRLDGLLIHSNVSGNEPGFARRGGALLVANRVTWEGISNYTMPRS